MFFSQSLSNNFDLKLEKSKSKSKMIKPRNTHSQKNSFKIHSHLSNKICSQINSQHKTPNQLIKDKYFRPAIKQYERSDANVITKCIRGDFEDFEGKSMEMYEFVKFYTVKQVFQQYESGITNNFRDRLAIISPLSFYNISISRHVFHFYDKNFYILRNRSMKLKNLLTLSNISKKNQKESSIKNNQRKKGSKSKSKSKFKSTDNLLKGIFSFNLGKSSQKLVKKIKKVNKLPLSRETHIISKDTQDMNHFLEYLSDLLKSHCIENYSEIRTQRDTIGPKNNFSRSMSTVSGTAANHQRSQAKQISKYNEFTQIMENQYSHLSAIKNSQVLSSLDQFQFYGLSQIKERKLKRQEKNSIKNQSKNQSYFANAQNSINESRLTDKKVPNTLKFSSIFTEQTPKKQAPHKIYDLKSKDQQSKKSKSNSKTLRKGLQQKSKSKSLSSAQKSLKKDPSAPLIFKNTKLLGNARSPKNMPQRLLFMEPLNEKEVKKPTLTFTMRGQDRKESKSKSKRKLMLIRK